MHATTAPTRQRRLDLLVRRKGTDPVAETCAYALGTLMRLPIDAVETGDLWRFECTDAADMAPDRLVQAACRAGRYVNTNRDRAAWVDWAHPGQAAAAGCTVDLWVRGLGGPDGVALRYFRTQGCSWLDRVEHGRWYRLWTRARDRAEARTLATEIALTRSRQHGLLLNPHMQQFEILAVQEPLPTETT